MPEKKNPISNWFESTNHKLSLIIAFIGYLQFVHPHLQTLIMGDKLEVLKHEILHEVDTTYGKKIRMNQVDVFRVREDHQAFRQAYMDDVARGKETIAVGLRVDPHRNLWYRTTYNKMYRAYRSYEHGKYRYTDSTGTSHFTDFED